MQTSLIDLWQTMGPTARGVVGLLLTMSIASFATAIERAWALRTARARLAEFEPEWRAVLARGGEHGLTSQVYDRLVRRQLLSTGSSLRRGMGVLATIGSTAPFVGLVGTVFGVMNAFEQIAAGGAGGLGKVSAGIAEALVTTAVGIGVAIPAVWLFNALSQRVGRLLVEIECRAQDVAVTALQDVH
mgnify:CR=1 FL=1